MPDSEGVMPSKPEYSEGVKCVGNLDKTFVSIPQICAIEIAV